MWIYFQIKPNTGSVVESKCIHIWSGGNSNFSRRRWAHCEIQTENKTNLKRLFISRHYFLFSSAENESYRVNSCTNQSDFSPAVEVFSCWRAVLIPVIWAAFTVASSVPQACVMLGVSPAFDLIKSLWIKTPFTRPHNYSREPQRGRSRK